MSYYLFNEIPRYHIDGFVSVRDSYDNILNILNFIETVNNCNHHMTDDENNIDLAIFTGDCSRLLVKKEDGYYTMSMPFQIIDHGDTISFNLNYVNLAITNQFISIMRSCVTLCKTVGHSSEDIILSICESYSVELSDAVMYHDTFSMLASQDHGYFRFDDDLPNSNGRVHPRYHFDFYMNNATSVKFGIGTNINFDFFKNLFDKTKAKPFLS